jgi:hypothetical protein
MRCELTGCPDQQINPPEYDRTDEDLDEDFEYSEGNWLLYQAEIQHCRTQGEKYSAWFRFMKRAQR